MHSFKTKDWAKQRPYLYGIATPVGNQVSDNSRNSSILFFSAKAAPSGILEVWSPSASGEDEIHVFFIKYARRDRAVNFSTSLEGKLSPEMPQSPRRRQRSMLREDKPQESTRASTPEEVYVMRTGSQSLANGLNNWNRHISMYSIKVD